MRQVADIETGDIYEALDSDLVGGEPYDYAGFRRMSMAVSRQHRSAIRAAKDAGITLARAKAEYHRQVALAIPGMKAEHGATIAEQMAKGEPDVKEAKEAMDIAEANERAAMETVRLVRSDRDAAQAMGYWSRESASAGWEK
jgi:hypothetical protein